MKTRTRATITAEALRPARVDELGRPDLITGDVPPAPAPVPAAPAAPPAPAPVAASDPPAPPAPAASDPPAPAAPPAPIEAAGVTTAEILAALGLTPEVRVHVTREPSPYLEAGGGISTEHGFFSDLYAGRARGDGEAAAACRAVSSPATRIHRGGESVDDRLDPNHPAGVGRAMVRGRNRAYAAPGRRI